MVGPLWVECTGCRLLKHSNVEPLRQLVIGISDLFSKKLIIGNLRRQCTHVIINRSLNILYTHTILICNYGSLQNIIAMYVAINWIK